MVEIDDKQIFSIFQKVKDSGKLKIGANEVTKAVERKQALLVISATDVSPAEIVAHFSGLCKEMNIAYVSVGTKAELGSLVGIKSTTALCVSDAGSAKKELSILVKEILGENESKKEEKTLDVKSEEKAKEASN